MQTTTLDDLLRSTTSPGPYQKSLRVKVVAVDQARSYTTDSGEGRQVLNVGVADQTRAVKAIVYDLAKFPRFQEGNCLLLRNVIKKPDSVIVTSATKVFPTRSFDVPEIICTSALHIIQPPPADVKPLREALHSPVKTKVSVQGYIVQEDAVREVQVRQDKVKVKAIYLRDATHPKCKVSLWREAAETSYRAGNHIQITDVIINTFRGETSLSTTSLTKIQECEAPEETSTLTVVGCCIEEMEATFLVNDDSFVQVPLDIVEAAFAECRSDELESHITNLCTPDLTVTLYYHSSKVTKMEI